MSTLLESIGNRHYKDVQQRKILSFTSNNYNVFQIKSFDARVLYIINSSETMSTV